MVLGPHGPAIQAPSGLISSASERWMTFKGWECHRIEITFPGHLSLHGVIQRRCLLSSHREKFGGLGPSWDGISLNGLLRNSKKKKRFIRSQNTVSPLLFL